MPCFLHIQKKMKRINTSVPYLSNGEKRPPSFHTTSLRVKTAAVADHNKEVLRQMEETHYKGGAECEINRPEQPALIVNPLLIVSFVCRRSCKPQLL